MAQGHGGPVFPRNVKTLRDFSTERKNFDDFFFFFLRIDVGVSQLLRGKLSVSWLAQREILVAGSR